MCSQYNDTMYDSLSIWRDVMSLALSLVTFERAEPAVEWNRNRMMSGTEDPHLLFGTSALETIHSIR